MFEIIHFHIFYCSTTGPLLIFSSITVQVTSSNASISVSDLSVYYSGYGSVASCKSEQIRNVVIDFHPDSSPSAIGTTAITVATAEGPRPA